VLGTIPTATGEITAPARVLVVVAHPDDVDFGTAGTMAALVSAGSQVSYCLVTSGDAGDDDLTRSSDDLAALRQSEQTAAALSVGVEDLHWLNYPDGRVENNLALRRDISRVIRVVRPDVVVTQPTTANWDRIYGAHPDHLAAAWATMAAVYPDARNPRSHRELLDEGHEPHTVNEVWMMWMAASEGTMMHVDITATFEKKVKALRCHSSQTDRIEGLEELLREWAAGVAGSAGMEAGRLAEGFRVINTE
tara:strand:- start:1495 stop:2244 length:750 start_codon:yes stop_codon:yes gene_type:complete